MIIVASAKSLQEAGEILNVGELCPGERICFLKGFVPTVGHTGSEAEGIGQVGGGIEVRFTPHIGCERFNTKSFWDSWTRNGAKHPV